MKSRQFNVLLRNETEKGINNIVCHFSFAYERVFFASPFETSSLCAFVWHNNVTKSFAGQEKKQQQMQKNVCMAIKPPRNVENKKKQHWTGKILALYFVISRTWKIFPSNTGEPSRSTFDAQSLLFGLRSPHNCGITIIPFVLLSVRTIWAVKHRTKFHHYAKTSRWPSNRSSDT